MQPSRGKAEEVIDVLVRVLTPYLGGNMARAIARGQCEKLRITTVQAITADQLARLGDALAPGLVVFVGRENTERVLEQVRLACRPEPPEGSHG